jgi:hypothetical protein
MSLFGKGKWNKAQKEEKMAIEAVVKIEYNCGCGFRTNNAIEAVKHSSEKKHMLTVYGTVKPVEK